MMWNRKIIYYTSALASGCYLLRYINKDLKAQCEIQTCNKIPEEDVSSFISVPEVLDYYFDEDDVSQKLSSPHHITPQYWKLLILTKSKKRTDRLKAVKLISSLNNLEKWEYMIISQACGPSTAIALARSSRIHQSFFLQPSFKISKMGDICQALLDLISSLDQGDPSVHLLIEKARKIGYRILYKKNLDMNAEPENFMDIFHSEKKKKEIFLFKKLCLEIVLHHSTIKSHKLMMVKGGILKLFWEILECMKHQTVLQSLVSQILANFALENELKNYLYCTGWIGILAAWSRSPHIEVSLPSAKALANLDDDESKSCLYDSNLYLLHPIIRLGDGKLDADVIFIHGINGATFWTWRQCDSRREFFKDYNPDNYNVLDLSSLISHNVRSYTFCWPKDWLAVDFPNLRFLSIDYNTGINEKKTLKSDKKEKENFCSKTKPLLSTLIKANVGEKPIIWITHSMGGLILKQLLIEAFKSEDVKTNLIAKNTIGIIFFSVPHKGSELVSVLKSIPYIFKPSIDLSQLHKDSPILLSLHNDFLKIVQTNSISILSFAETKKSKWLLNWQLVSKESAYPGVGEFHLLPVDHLSTCKPESKDSYVYIKVKEFLQYNIFIRNNVPSTYFETELNNYIFLIP